MTETDRRTVLRDIFLVAATSTFFANHRFAYADEFAADPQFVAKWLDTWNETHKAVKGALILGRFADPIYFLRSPITWVPNKGQEQLPTVTVPVGFVTDLASIPRTFWSLLRPDGLYAYAAIVHDYLYWTQSSTKEAADLVFKSGMEDFKVDPLTVNAIYEAVHLFGAPAWEQNKKLKLGGERRILKRFPDDPTITWESYKKRLDVFDPI